MDQLAGRILQAHRTYRDQASDLTDHVAARGKSVQEENAERERRALSREYEKQEEHRCQAAERKREEQQERAAILRAGESAALWAYRTNKQANSEWFEIRLTTLNPPRQRLELMTAVNVQAVLERKRSQKPFLPVRWGRRTAVALREWRGNAVDGWQALTGARIDPRPRDPNAAKPPKKASTPAPRTNRHSRGPSSNYWSPGGYDGGSIRGF